MSDADDSATFERIEAVVLCCQTGHFDANPDLVPDDQEWPSWDLDSWAKWSLDEVAKILADRKPPEPPPERVEPPKAAKSNAEATRKEVPFPETLLCLVGEARRALRLAQHRGVTFRTIQNAWAAFAACNLLAESHSCDIADEAERAAFRRDLLREWEWASAAMAQATADEERRLRPDLAANQKKGGGE